MRCFEGDDEREARRLDRDNVEIHHEYFGGVGGDVAYNVRVRDVIFTECPFRSTRENVIDVSTLHGREVIFVFARGWFARRGGNLKVCRIRDA